MNNSRWIHEMTWEEVRSYLQDRDTVLVPVGATEQHGRHMAAFMDTAWATGISEAVARRSNVLIAPPVHYGWGPHHLAYPGTITLRSQTLTQVCVDIGESLAYQGFKKIIFVNGNRVANLPAMQLAASHLRHKTGAFVAVADTGLIAKRAVRDICTSAPGGLGHAGESETSYMLHLHPEFVDMAKAQKQERKHGRFHTSAANLEPPYDAETVYVPAIASEFFAATEATGGVAGDAAAATADKGEKILNVITEALSAFLEQVVFPKNVELKPLDIPG